MSKRAKKRRDREEEKKQGYEQGWGRERYIYERVMRRDALKIERTRRRLALGVYLRVVCGAWKSSGWVSHQRRKRGGVAFELKDVKMVSEGESDHRVERK